MADPGCGSGFSHETAPGSFATDEMHADQLQGDWASKVGIDGLVGYSHTAAPKLQRRSVFISKNLVMLKTELRTAV
jgi:hypothetical protein